MGNEGDKLVSAPDRRALLTVIDQLEEQVLSGTIPQADGTWGGADVIVAAKEPETRDGCWYGGSDQWVVTPFALELSWVLEQLRDMTRECRLIDHMSKYEFYGRLAEAAIRRIEARPASAEVLCQAALCEARLMVVELTEQVQGA